MSIRAQKKQNNWNTTIKDYQSWHKKSNYYYKQLLTVFKEFISSGKNVLEIYCGGENKD